MTRKKQNQFYSQFGIVHDSIYDPEDDWTIACLGTDADYIRKFVEDGSSIQTVSAPPLKPQHQNRDYQ